MQVCGHVCACRYVSVPVHMCGCVCRCVGVWVLSVYCIIVLLFHERGNPFSQGWYKWGTLKLQLEIRKDGKVSRQVANDIVKLLLMLTIKVYTDRNSISPCNTCTNHDSVQVCGCVCVVGAGTWM